MITLTLKIATLRATLIIKRASRRGGAFLASEFHRAIAILVKAGLTFAAAVRFAVVTRATV